MLFRAIRDFLQDLLANNPVALIITAVLIVIVPQLLIALVCFLISRARHREEKEREERCGRRGY